MAVQSKGNAVHAANLGLYLDRPALLVPERGLSAGNNFRVVNGQVTNLDVGYSAFESLNLDSKPVLLIEQFTPNTTASAGLRKTIFGNTTDLFEYFNDILSYLTPRHDATGETVAVTNGSPVVTGTGTTWQTDGIKAGDFFSLGANRITPTPAGTWYQIQSVDSETQITLTANYNEATLGGQAYTIRKTFTTDLLNPWMTTTFRDATAVTSGVDGDRWYATNGIDKVVAWDGDTNQVYYSHSAVNTCKALARFKNVLILVAPTIGGVAQEQDISSSAIGQPENLATLEASQFTVHDGGDSLIAAKQIGELLAIYAERAIILAQYVGSPLMYVFRTAVSGYGARSPRGILGFPDRHKFFGHDGQYTFDGISARQSNQHIWKELTRIASPSRNTMVQAVIDEGRAEEIWTVPLNTDADPTAGPPENSYTAHYLEEVGDFPTPHSRRALPATAVGTYIASSVLTFDQVVGTFDQQTIRWDDQALQSAFAQVLIGTNTGAIFSLGGQTQNGVTPAAFVRFSRRPLADSRRKAVVKRVYPNVDFSTGSSNQMTVKVRTMDSPNSTIVSETEYNMTLDGTERFAPFRAAGRFAEIEMGSGATVVGTWQIEGFDMDTVPIGDR